LTEAVLLESESPPPHAISKRLKQSANMVLGDKPDRINIASPELRFEEAMLFGLDVK
jgi:hypothetical protein